MLHFSPSPLPPSLRFGGQGKLWRLKRGVAQLASVPALGAGGRQFESDHPDPYKTQSAMIQLIAFIYLY